MSPPRKRTARSAGARRAPRKTAAAAARRRAAKRSAHGAAGSGAATGRGGKAAGTATSHDVAALAGVSRSAVSRTFTPDASVSEKTRKKVLAAASQLGYQPNVIARSLITRQSRLIGLIMSEWENPFYTTMLRGFTEKLGERGYRVMLIASRAPGDVEAAMQMLMQYRVDGMVLVSALPSPETAAAYVRSGGRLVIVNRDPGGLPATVIVNDNARIGRELGGLLLAGGHERIALVRGDALLASGVARAAALREVVAASGRARIIVDRTGALGYEAGRAFGNEMMARDERPDVIVCSTDMTAIGVLDAVRIDCGLDVPGEIGIAGFGDVPASAWASHRLTTVRLPLERMIDEAVATVLAEAAPPLTAPRLVVVGGDVVVRETLRAAPPARSPV